MTLARVDFNPQDFEDILQQKGYRLTWEKAIRCACIDPATLRPTPDCISCDGRGHYYYDPTEIRGVITRQSQQLELGSREGLGILEPGSAYVTVSHNNYLSQFDRITNLDSSVKYTETLVHSEKSGDWLSYPVISMEIAITQPNRLAPTVILQPNVDFTLEADGKINWISSKKPADKVGVSFAYFMHPVWLITSMPNYVRDTFVLNGNTTDTVAKMPIRAEMRLEFLGPASTS